MSSNNKALSGMIPMSPEAALNKVQNDPLLADYVDYITMVWAPMHEIHHRLAEYVLDLPDPAFEGQWLLKSCMASACEVLGTRKNSTCEEIAESYFKALLSPITRLKNLSVIMSREDSNPDVNDEVVWDSIEDPYSVWRKSHTRYDSLFVEIVSTCARYPSDATLTKIIAAKLMSRVDAVAFGSRMI